MKKSAMPAGRQGFTLIELLVGVTISAMIFLTAGSVISLFFRTDVKTRRVENFEQTKNDLQAEISNSVRWAEVINFRAGDLGSLTADSNEFTISNGRILKNSSPITSNNIIVTKFKIRDMSTNQDLKSLEVQIDMESEQTATSKDTLMLVVSQRQSVISNNP